MRTFAEPRSSIVEPVTIIEFSKGLIREVVFNQDFLEKDFSCENIYEKNYHEETTEDWIDFSSFLSNHCGRLWFHLDRAPRIVYLPSKSTLRPLFLYLTENGAKKLAMNEKELIVKTQRELRELSERVMEEIIAVLPWSAE